MIKKEQRSINVGTGSYKKVLKYFLFVGCCLLLCFISVLSTILIMKNNNSTKTIPTNNVDMGKSPYISMVGFSQERYDSYKKFNPKWEGPIFDKCIAWGPENASGTIELDIINKSNLLNEKDKATLLEYESTIKTNYSIQDVDFQIAFGVKDNIDYVFLINYCGYISELGEEVNNTFLFKSNLSYSFESIVKEFEQQTGKELTDEYLNSAQYDRQRLLTVGIIINFIEIEGNYQEYYILKLDGEVFVLNK